MKKFKNKKEVAEGNKLRKQTDKIENDWDQDELYKDFENEQSQTNRNNPA